MIAFAEIQLEGNALGGVVYACLAALRCSAAIHPPERVVAPAEAHIRHQRGGARLVVVIVGAVVAPFAFSMGSQFMCLLLFCVIGGLVCIVLCL